MLCESSGHAKGHGTQGTMSHRRSFARSANSGLSRLRRCRFTITAVGRCASCYSNGRATARDKQQERRIARTRTRTQCIAATRAPLPCPRPARRARARPPTAARRMGLPLRSVISASVPREPLPLGVTHKPVRVAMHSKHSGVPDDHALHTVSGMTSFMGAECGRDPHALATAALAYWHRHELAEGIRTPAAACMHARAPAAARPPLPLPTAVPNRVRRRAIPATG